ncbi:MAG: tetratricopeptide repeat protein [Catenulisporales bacterium]|nr:tetratricopeptide repeat protein [Catenulisporales bacterium]
MFAWSYRHLPGTAARVFRLLGLHPGADFGLDSAAAVAGEPPARIREHLDALTGAHLLECIVAERFRFHDLLRGFAAHCAERDEAAEAREAAVRRVVDFYLGAMARAAAQVLDLPPPVPMAPEADSVTLPEFGSREQAIAWYESEKDTILAVGRMAAAHGFDDASWQLPVVGEPLFDLGWDHALWLETAELGLSAALRLADPAAEAAVRYTLGAACKMVGDYSGAVEHSSRAVELFEVLNNRPGIAQAANRLALAYFRLRRFEQAAAGFRRALDSLEPGESDSARLFIVGNLADCYLAQGEAEESLRICEHLPAAAGAGLGELPQSIKVNAVRLVRAYTELGAFDRAEECVETYSDRLTGNLRHRMLLAHAELRVQQGRLTDALRIYESCITLQSVEGVRDRAEALDGKGRVLRLLGNVSEGLPFHVDAAAVRRGGSDTFELARTLCFLSEAYEEAADLPMAAQAREEALSLLTSFHDPRANELRRRLEARNHSES